MGRKSMGRKSGRITQRGERTWLVRVFLGTEKVIDPETGEPKINPKTGRPVINNKYHNKTIHGTKKDAQAYLNKVLRERDMGTYIEPAKLSLDEYLAKWLATAAKPRLRPRTFESYERLLRCHVRPTLGNRALSAITPMEIQALYNGMQEQKDLSARTVRYVHAVLRNALGQAVKWRFLQQNPTDNVDLPRQQREEMSPLSSEEVKHFLEACEEDRFGMVFRLLLTTGLRPGEALALRWSDVDLEAGRLHVQRSLVPGKGFEEPKTARARRVVPLPPSVTKAVKQHKKAQTEARLQAGENWQDLNLMFTGSEGQPVHYRNLVRRHFKPLLVKARLPENLRLYDLRHTHATLLLKEGVNPKIVSERLGHASITLTLDTYSHVLPDMQKEVVEKLETLFAEC